MARRHLLARLVSAQEEERARIASGIHDDSIQKLTVAALRLHMLKADHPELGSDEGFQKAERAIERSIESMRHLLFELRPHVLDRDGLAAALRVHLAEESSLGDFEYDIETSLQTEPPVEIGIILYRIAQEALTNARKHARATRLAIHLSEQNGGYLIRIEDDGVSFDTAEGSDSPEGHLGVTSMRERAEMAGKTPVGSEPDSKPNVPLSAARSEDGRFGHLVTLCPSAIESRFKGAVVGGEHAGDGA